MDLGIAGKRALVTGVTGQDGSYLTEIKSCPSDSVILVT